MIRAYICVLALLLASCAPIQVQPSVPAAATPVVVNLLVSGDPPEQAAYAAVIEGFHAQQDGIRVEMTAVPGTSDFLTRLTTDFAAGTPPDLFLLNYRRMAQFYNLDAIEPLGPMLQASTSLDEEKFYPVALDAFRDSQGTVICLPQNVSSQVVYYNKALFDQAGVPYPTPNWSWEEFRQTALALTQPDGDGDGFADQYGLGLEAVLIRMLPWIWQNGGEVVDDPQHPTRLALEGAVTREALEFVINLARNDGVVPLDNAHADRFVAGNVAMYIDSRVFTPTLREAAEFDWDVAPLPQGQQQANVLHSDGYCMASASKVKDAAWHFIEYAMGDEGQTIASRLGRTVPSLRHLAESPVFLDPDQPPAAAQVWLDNLESNMRVVPKIENWNAIERTAANEFEQVYLGQQSLDDAIANIEVAAADGFIPMK